MEEQWKPVVGWENLYLVSSIGRVNSIELLLFAQMVVHILYVRKC